MNFSVLFFTQKWKILFLFFYTSLFFGPFNFQDKQREGRTGEKNLNFILFIFKILNPKNFFPKDCDNNTSYT